MNQKKIANLGLFAAVAIIFGYVESLIPFFAGIPGMKLGLANLAVLFILEKYTWKEAALVQYPLQPRRGCTQSYRYDSYEEKIWLQHSWNQRRRGRVT